MVKTRPNKHSQANYQELFRNYKLLITDLIRFLSIVILFIIMFLLKEKNNTGLFLDFLNSEQYSVSFNLFLNFKHKLKKKLSIFDQW